MKVSTGKSKVVCIDQNTSFNRTTPGNAARLLAKDIARLSRQIRENAATLRKSLQQSGRSSGEATPDA